MFEASHDGVVLFDEEGTIADWSPAAERILGYTRDRMVGRDLLTQVFPERLRPAMQGVLGTRGAAWGDAARRTIEVSLLHSSGTEVPVELSLSWAGGSGLFAVAIRDARERSARERELASEARRRSRLLELGELALGTRDGLDSLVARSLSIASSELGLASCEFWELSPGGGELVLQRSHGGGSMPGARLTPADGSRVAQALRSQTEAVVVGDALLPSPWLAPEDYREGMPTGIAGIVLGAGGAIGVISGASVIGGRFSSADVGYLESISQIVALAFDRERFNRTLADAEERLRTLIERLPAITYRAGLGPSGSWHFISPQVEEILGLSPEYCLAHPTWWSQRLHESDVERVLAAEEAAARDGTPLDIEYRIRAEDGRLLWMRDRASTGQTAEGAPAEVVVDGILTDITTQKEAEERLRHLADHDHLTTLLNRRGFEAAVDSWLRAAANEDSAALAIIDLDHLKRINDSLGHAAGDSLLREIAAAIRLSLRDDDVLSRLGGDEFGLFIPGIDETIAQGRLAELNALIRQSGQGGPLITASAGVIMVEASETARAADLLVQADLALYQAKEGGRDRVAFSDEHDARALGWVGEIRQAIEEERLALYAQPIFDLKTGEHHSFELLARMLTRTGKPIPANQFIPTAERFGMIQTVDHWVVSRAVDLALAGNRVSVNLSAASIGDTSLTDMVERRLGAGPHEPGILTFEITETVATPTIDTLSAFAERVERLGCALSLDDVGTGFGTLTYLQNLHFSELKIDAGFVERILDSQADVGIVRAIVVIASELGLQTVAEGVESAAMLERLRTLGVDHAQGHYLGTPTRVELPPRG